jgi:hypothetical protein
MAAAGFAAVFGFHAWAQQQTQRVAGTIDKPKGKTLYIRSATGLTLADNALIFARVKATAPNKPRADKRAARAVAPKNVLSA